MDWQEPISLALVAAAAFLLGREYLRRKKNRGITACGGSCGGCVPRAGSPGDIQSGDQDRGED
jgi:hypothetical protein